VFNWIKRDSIIHARDSAYLIAKGFIREVKDTLKLEDEGVENEDLEKLKLEVAELREMLSK
jgi:hypothetical protein